MIAVDVCLALPVDHDEILIAPYGYPDLAVQCIRPPALVLGRRCGKSTYSRDQIREPIDSARVFVRL